MIVGAGRLFSGSGFRGWRVVGVCRSRRGVRVGHAFWRSDGFGPRGFRLGSPGFPGLRHFTRRSAASRVLWRLVLV